MAPLTQTRQLTAVLLQFPSSFSRTPKNRHYLAALLGELHGLPLAVEFRHASWVADRVFAELERRRITLVTVDEPSLPGLFVITSYSIHYTKLYERPCRTCG